MKRAIKALIGFILVALTVSLVGCDEPAETTSSDSFGLPGKGDQSCDPEAVLCWNDEDSSAARHLMQVESEVLVGDLPLSALYDAVTPLSHKLNQDERSALDAIELDPELDSDEERAELVKESFTQVYGRALSGYWGAHATLLAEAIEGDEEGDGKADGDMVAPIPSALSIPEQLRPAFESLWAEGPFGQYLVTMIALTGAAEHKVRRIPFEDRVLVGNVPIDLEAEWISNRFARYAAMESTLANLTGLIPVVGVWVSVPYGIYGQFKQRMKLTLELATLYGLDPTTPDDFLICVQLLTAAQGYPELFSYLIKAVVGTQAHRLFSEHQPELLPDEFSERRIKEVQQASFAQLAVIGGRIMAEILRKTATGGAKALLGQVTLGISALADISIDYINTIIISRELRYALHPWGVGAFHERADWLAIPEYRSCAYSLLTNVARANYDVSEPEARFMIESLIRPFYIEEGERVDSAELVNADYAVFEGDWGSYLSAGLVIDHLAESTGLDPYACSADTFGDEDSLTRLSLLAWLELMAWSDRHVSPEEEMFLGYVGEVLRLKVDEERVYDAMRERVSVYRYYIPNFSSVLPIWIDGIDAKVEAVTADDVFYEVWSLMR